MHLIHLLVFLAIGWICLDDPKKPDLAQADFDKLQGTWMSVSIVSDGKVVLNEKSPPAEGQQVRLVYEGPQWKVRIKVEGEGNLVVATGTTKLDPGKSPKEIDVIHENGKNKGQTLLGIYELDEKLFKYCIAQVGKPRPKEFVSRPGTGDSLVINKREETAPPEPAARAQSNQTGKPELQIPTVELADAAEPGEKLVFTFKVLDYQGKPLPKAAVVVHHADKEGSYTRPGSTSRVPRLQGVGITNAEGWVRFSTVRPGAYPNGKEPAHIHVIVAAPMHKVQFVAFWFEGDPLITEKRRADLAKDPETKIVKPTQGRDGVWTFEYEAHLEDS